MNELMNTWMKMSENVDLAESQIPINQLLAELSGYPI